MTNVSKETNLMEIISSVRRDYHETVTNIIKNNKHVDQQEATNAWLMKKIGEFELRLTIFESKFAVSKSAEPTGKE